jgi:hypothetical protein
MSLGSVRIIKKPPPIGVMKQAINQEISKQLQPVGRQHVNERKRVVSNFDTEIVFGYRISVTDKQITLTVLLENADTPVSDDWTVGDLWKALDSEGTRPHEIKPKDSNGKLVFNWGGPGSYDAKTKPVAKSGGSGEVRNGVKTVRKRVSHPGFEPRKFSETINKRLRRQFDAAIDRGLRLGLKKR